jgi:2-polyprenyl-3-methyl-5-hydroxy-6-metoxy-1,4-benzoquinol methylase
MSFNKKNFWEKKIREWEKKRYSNQKKKSQGQPFLKRLLGSSLQFRLLKTVKLLAPYVTNKKILDLGCGSGLLWRAFDGYHLNRYIGIDWASSAIDKAKIDVSAGNKLPPAEFIAGNFLDMDLPEFDMVVALGVLDWLDLDEIDTLFKKIGPNKFLFSISEKRFSFYRIMHAAYVYFSYGQKTEGYVPKYYKVEEIMSIAKNHGYSSIQVFRDPKLSFGALLYKID